MPSNEELERHLAAAPRQQLSPTAMQEIIAAILAAERSNPRPWWRGRVSLWQAMAACIVFAVMGFGLSRAGLSPRHEASRLEDERTTLVSFYTPVFQSRSRPSYQTDITRWQATRGELLAHDRKGTGAP